MLHKYYVNNSAQQNGDHEVHEEHLLISRWHMT